MAMEVRMKLAVAPLYSGSGGNATYVGTETCSLLVDAGLPGSAIENALRTIDKKPAHIRAILITHEHTDHIKGVGVLSRRYNIPIYANAQTWAQMERSIGDISRRNTRVIDEGDFFIGDILVTPIPLSHDAANPFGYSLCAGGRKVTILTDSGKISGDMLSRAEHSDIVLLESNHDVDMLKCGRYPYQLKTRILSSHGHLSNEDCAKAAVELVKRGGRGILLAHLSKENNFEELAYRTVYETLSRENIKVGKDVALGVTKKAQVTGFFPL